ncbi:MAG: response regulator transcription factor [Deltaproteobacteria bacterium]|nr:response regulator transcription factor [Deltaproteobacteria bacterium]
MAKIRVALADDHPIMLDGIENLLRSDPDFEVVARCRSGEETLKAVADLEPDVLVLDLRMPGMGGLDVLRRLREGSSPTRVVILTGALEPLDLVEAVRLGLEGLVLKEMAPEILVQCLKAVHAGAQWLERGSMGRAMEAMLDLRSPDPGLQALTAREREVVAMAAHGLRNKQIADRLFLSEGTVKVHLHKIYEKLGLDGRMALIVWARERGLT